MSAPPSLPHLHTRAAAAATRFYGAPQRHRLIAETAYFRSLHRGFLPGHELDDWLAAETEVDAALTIGVPQ